ncbi:MAG: hypothetical protein JRG80_08650 [Deltaproteobacteria bacterium]|nr:hypothetical protein [Deltaproteobacteria bacterium]MBW2665693.1 hypothetical protein [Deltaproteobacteria bacterium]
MRATRTPRFAWIASVTICWIACGGEPSSSVDVVRIVAPKLSLQAAPGSWTARLIESDGERELVLEVIAGRRGEKGWREWSLREAPDGAVLGRLALGSDEAALLHHLAARDRDLGFALESSRLVRLSMRDGERLGLWFEGDRAEAFSAAAELEATEAARLVALAQALGAWQVVANDRYPVSADGAVRLPLFTPKPLSDWRVLRQRSLEFVLPPALGRQFATREGFRTARDRALARYTQRLPLLAEAVERFVDAQPEAERSEAVTLLAPRLRESAAAYAGYLDSAWVEFVLQVVSPDSARVRILVHSVVDVRIDAVLATLPGKVLVTESAALAGLRMVPVAGGGPVRAYLGKDRVEFRLGLPVAPRAPEVDSFQSVELEYTLTGLEALGGNLWPLLGALRLQMTNSITGADVSGEHVQRSLSFADPRFAVGPEPPIESFLAALPSVLVRFGDAAPAALVLDRRAHTLTLPEGDYHLTADFIPPAGYGLVIAAGVSLRIDPGRSLLIRGPLRVRGTAQQPVRLRGAKLAQPWGVLAVQGRGRSVVAARRPRSEIRYLELSGGSQDQLKGAFYSGQLSVHHQDLSLQHATLSRAFGDDALNVKYGNIDIRDSVFADNHSDAIDLDWCDGTVTRSFFGRSGRGGDGLDLSGSKVTVTDSVFSAQRDKCLSVGEASTLWLRGSLLRDCEIALASKDDSVAEVQESLFLENERNFAAFVKKPIFGGATIRGSGLLLIAAEKPDTRGPSSVIELDHASMLEHVDESGLELDALRKTASFSSARFRSIEDSRR